MASACFSFGRRFPGLAGAECLSEGTVTEPGWRTDYGGGKGRKNSAERGMAGFGAGGGGCEKGAGKGAGKDSETAPGISGTKGKPENAEGRADDSGVRRLFGL